MGFLTHLDQEWSVISAAPFTFVTSIALAAIVVWFFARLYYKGRIETLDGRLKLRDDEIADYKRKLDGATPDEAKGRLDALETTVAALRGRHLTKEQTEAIRQEASVASGSIRIVSDTSAADAGAYAGQLQDAFKAAGWSAQGGSLMGSGTASKFGAIVTFGPMITMTSRQAATSAFAKAGIDVEFREPKGGLLEDVDVHVIINRVSSS